MQLSILITNLKFFENIRMKREAGAQDYQVLPLHACMSIFSANFSGSGFDLTLNGMPNVDVISGLFIFEVGHSSLVVPVN